MQACKYAGYEVRALSSCKDNSHREALEQFGVPTFQCDPNDSRFDAELLEYRPDIVIFDRFMLEEQFGWRVRQHCPDAVRVLDTVDLHALRRSRQKKIENGESSCTLSSEDFQSEDALREVSAIFRSDLSLLVSNFERSLLSSRYQVPEEMLSLTRMHYRTPENQHDFEQRNNFVTIGNFRHAPNADSYRVLHQKIWKPLRRALSDLGLPGVELHIYGAYPTREFLDLDDPSTGFRVLGWVPNAQETLSRYRVNLAPLRFGAGIKGKISDGWAVGTPCVGTSIAAEGMCENLEFGGLISDEWDNFITSAALLYAERAEWVQAQARGNTIIESLYSEGTTIPAMLNALTGALAAREQRRSRNMIGAMLWQNQLRSTEYFSRWIEVKKLLATPPSQAPKTESLRD